MNKVINILELAAGLAEQRLRDEEFSKNFEELFPDGIDVQHENGDFGYTEEAQEVFNDYYDYYLSMIEKYSEDVV